MRAFVDNLLKLRFTSEKQIKGFDYFVVCVPSVLSFIQQDDSIINPLLPLLSNDSKEKTHYSVSDFVNLNEKNKKIAIDIFKEFYFNAVSIDKQIKKPSLDIINKSIDSSTNRYNEIPNSLLEHFKTVRFTTLIESIGEILIDNGYTDSREIFSLAYTHHNLWKYSPDGLTFSSSVIKSNILPTHLADVINSIPLPNAFNSNPDLWTVSKEISNRIHDEKYSLDNETKEWIWLIHNYIFYNNDDNSIKDKYQNHNGFNEMLFDIFLNIGNKGKLSKKLISKNNSYLQRYSKREDWAAYITQINKLVAADYGIAHLENFNSVGELHSLVSFKFINAVMLYIERNSKWRRFLKMLKT